MPHNSRHPLSPEDLQKVMATIDIPTCPGMLTELRHRIGAAISSAAS